MNLIRLLELRLADWADDVTGGKALLAVLSLIAFNIVFTAPVAFVVYAALIAHECGHAWGARRRGAAVRGIYLFPWWNGRCIYGSCFLTERDAVFATMMGLIFGAGFGLAIFLAFLLSGQDILAFCACGIAAVTIVNLVPYANNDGSKIVWAVIGRTGPPRVPLPWQSRVLWLSAYLVTAVIAAVMIRATVSPVFVQDVELFFRPLAARGIRLGADYLSRFLL